MTEIVRLPLGPVTVERFYRVSGRRSADFSILSRDFPFSAGEEHVAARKAEDYKNSLRRMGFDEIKGYAIISDPVDFLTWSRG